MTSRGRPRKPASSSSSRSGRPGGRTSSRRKARSSRRARAGSTSLSATTPSKRASYSPISPSARSENRPGFPASLLTKSRHHDAGGPDEEQDRSGGVRQAGHRPLAARELQGHPLGLQRLSRRL